MIKAARAGLLILLCFCLSCDSTPDPAPPPVELGRFLAGQDLLLAQYDGKSDVDDLHSIAALASMLTDERFVQVDYHAVAGAYGTQGGGYIQANELFEAAFGENWSDAHTDWDRAVAEVSDVVLNALDGGGDVWIAEAGQSDFTAAWLRSIQEVRPNLVTSERIYVVQHSDWNEENTTPSALRFVRNQTSYSKIPDGNATGNGTPGFRSNQRMNEQNRVSNPGLQRVWQLAFDIGDEINGTGNYYDNEFVGNGGMDFSDAVEVCWIFGFEDLRDVWQFLDAFLPTS